MVADKNSGGNPDIAALVNCPLAHTDLRIITLHGIFLHPDYNMAWRISFFHNVYLNIYRPLVFGDTSPTLNLASFVL